MESALNLLEEIEKIIDDPENGVHCVYVGRCTMLGSPGIFAMANTDIGRSLYGTEGRTPEEALTKLIVKIQAKAKLPQPEDVMRQAAAARVMPGLPAARKLPGM